MRFWSCRTCLFLSVYGHVLTNATYLKELGCQALVPSVSQCRYVASGLGAALCHERGRQISDNLKSSGRSDVAVVLTVCSRL